MTYLGPYDEYLRQDRMPHIWCSGCGIGIAMGAYIRALKKSDLSLDDVVTVSGIGCTGRVAGYINTDSFHTTHGRAIPFATGIKLAKPEMKVVVFSGDGDLISIGGNHFIHSARRNVDLTVICVNNFNYGMTGGQVAPTTPIEAKTTTTPYGTFDPPMNLVYLAAASGASYVARWTTYHVRHLENSIRDALRNKGFSFIEVITPCPTLYLRRNRLGTAVDMMEFFKKNTVTKNGADPSGAGIDFQSPFIVGKFIDRATHTLLDNIKKAVPKVRA